MESFPLYYAQHFSNLTVSGNTKVKDAIHDIQNNHDIKSLFGTDFMKNHNIEPIPSAGEQTIYEWKKANPDAKYLITPKCPNYSGPMPCMMIKHNQCDDFFPPK